MPIAVAEQVEVRKIAAVVRLLASFEQERELDRRPVAGAHFGGATVLGRRGEDGGAMGETEEEEEEEGWFGRAHEDVLVFDKLSLSLSLSLSRRLFSCRPVRERKAKKPMFIDKRYGRIARTSFLGLSKSRVDLDSWNLRGPSIVVSGEACAWNFT